MSTSSNTLLLGTRKGLLTVERNGSGWKVTREAFPGIPIAFATRDPRTGTLWACQDHGHWAQKLNRSKDNGETWEEVEAPKYPEGAMAKEDEPATLKYLWYLQPGGNDQPERLYIGTEPGGLFQTDDGGDNWTLVESLWNHPSRMQWFGGGRDNAGIHSIMVDPRNSDRVLVGVSCAGIFETTDGGKTWDHRNKGMKADFLPDPDADIGQDPHYVTYCPSNPDALWQQNHCGIFRSTDGAQNWSKVSGPEGNPADFGFVIAADENDPDAAWVVPAHSDMQRMAINGALVVCRTEDGGQTWQELRNGLPQEGCYDVTYRHAMDKKGDSIAFGTTSGNAFISTDRGDSWECLGNYFPLIYSARFI